MLTVYGEEGAELMNGPLRWYMSHQCDPESFDGPSEIDEDCVGCIHIGTCDQGSRCNDYVEAG